MCGAAVDCRLGRRVGGKARLDRQLRVTDLVRERSDPELAVAVGPPRVDAAVRKQRYGEVLPRGGGGDRRADSLQPASIESRLQLEDAARRRARDAISEAELAIVVGSPRIEDPVVAES